MTARVVVVGSANADITIPVGHVPGRGETVLGGSLSRGPGGKGLNQAVAAARMGVPTAFVGAVGDDADGSALTAFLAESGVDAAAVAVVSEPTGLAVILLEPDGANRIIVAPGANARVDASALDVQPGDVLAAQLETSLATVATACRAARSAGATTVLNAAPVHDGTDALLDDVDVLVVNEPELDALTRNTSLDDLRADRAVVVTLGADGARLLAGETEVTISAPSVEVVDTTGAGDCFVGVLCAALSQHRDLASSARAAVEAASLSVTRPGAASAMPVRHALSTLDPLPPKAR